MNSAIHLRISRKEKADLTAVVAVETGFIFWWWSVFHLLTKRNHTAPAFRKLPELSAIPSGRLAGKKKDHFNDGMDGQLSPHVPQVERDG